MAVARLKRYSTPDAIQERVAGESPISQGDRILRLQSSLQTSTPAIQGFPKDYALNRETVPLCLEWRDHGFGHSSVTLAPGSRVESVDWLRFAMST